MPAFPSENTGHDDKKQACAENGELNRGMRTLKDGPERCGGEHRENSYNQRHHDEQVKYPNTRRACSPTVFAPLQDFASRLHDAVILLEGYSGHPGLFANNPERPKAPRYRNVVSASWKKKRFSTQATPV